MTWRRAMRWTPPASAIVIACCAVAAHSVWVGVNARQHLRSEHVACAAMVQSTTMALPLLSIDGCVTTFAVIAGALGGGFSNVVLLVLGTANLVADGFSMAVGNYQSKRTQAQSIEQARATEAVHIEEIPEGEREEVRQIFAAKGFEGEMLQKVVDVITHDRGVWIDTMLKEEIHVHPEVPHPLRAALATFIAFVVAGSIPLLPFAVLGRSSTDAFFVSAIATGATYFAIGAIRAVVLGNRIIYSALSTFVSGGAAAAVAYFIASWLRQMFGAPLL